MRFGFIGIELCSASRVYLCFNELLKIVNKKGKSKKIHDFSHSKPCENKKATRQDGFKFE
jgi:hypothetical protein